MEFSLTIRLLFCCRKCVTRCERNGWPCVDSTMLLQTNKVHIIDVDAAHVVAGIDDQILLQAPHPGLGAMILLRIPKIPLLPSCCKPTIPLEELGQSDIFAVSCFSFSFSLR